MARGGPKPVSRPDHCLAVAAILLGLVVAGGCRADLPAIEPLADEDIGADPIDPNGTTGGSTDAGSTSVDAGNQAADSDGTCKSNAECADHEFCYDGKCTTPGSSSGGSSGGTSGSSGSSGGSSSGGPKPKSCSSEADCENNGCPKEVKKCTCAQTPDGKLCVPACKSTADCPVRPGKGQMICAEAKFCRPAKK